jgi:hypothetical protein
MNRRRGRPNPVGGYTPERVALRRAMVLAYDVDGEIDDHPQGPGDPAQSPVAPGRGGLRPDFHSPAQDYDPRRPRRCSTCSATSTATATAARAARRQPLVIRLKYDAGSAEKRQLAELYVKSLRRGPAHGGAGGDVRRPPQGQEGQQLHDRDSAWIADYPDAQNFLQLLYGPNTASRTSASSSCPSTTACTRNRRASRQPERNALYREMNRLLLAYAPWRLGVHRIFNHCSARG